MSDNINTTLDPATPYGSLDPAPMISQQEFDEIIRQAIDTFGEESQTRILFEEMAELQDAICKFSRGRTFVDHVCEEIADLLIMCMQMAKIYGEDRVQHWATLKITRLKSRIATLHKS